MFRCQSQIERR